MKKFLILSGLMILLLFGCLGFGDQTQKVQNASSNVTPLKAPLRPTQNPTTVLPAQKDCSPSYIFTDPAPGTLSKTTKITGTVTCAQNKTIALKLDGVQVAKIIPSTDASSPVSFNVFPSKEGTLALTILSDGETIFSREFNVSPLGNVNSKGNEYDSVTLKEWRAMAVDIDGPLTIARARILMKRYDIYIIPNERIRVDIRSDAGGNPSSTIVGSASRSINATSLSENWLSFDFDNSVSLQPGRYWIVVSIPQDPGVSLVSDVVGIHTIANNKKEDGNDYTRMMKLSLDSQGNVHETTWEPLGYDRAYSMALYTQKIGR